MFACKVPTASQAASAASRGHQYARPHRHLSPKLPNRSVHRHPLGLGKVTGMFESHISDRYDLANMIIVRGQCAYLVRLADSTRPVTVSSRCAVTREARAPAAGPPGGVPVARNACSCSGTSASGCGSPSTCAGRSQRFRDCLSGRYVLPFSPNRCHADTLKYDLL